MLHELKNARQIPGEGYRRWFTDPDLDLVVWYQDQTLAEIHGFQLSYDKNAIQHALTWTYLQGFQHNRVDDGEDVFANKMTPVLVPAHGFEGTRLQAQFEAAAAGLEHGLRALVRERIGEFDRIYHQIGQGGGTGAPRPAGQALPGSSCNSLLARLLLDPLRDAFYGPGLHGPSLLPTLRSLDPEQVRWKPDGQDKAAGAWQIALHCAYWKRMVTKQICGHLGIAMDSPVHRFELADWVADPGERDFAEWQECLEGLCQEHEAMVRAFEALFARESSGLTLVESASGFSWAQYACGMAAHDVYHTAQLRNGGLPGIEDH